jgi:hypothetical protein
LIAFRYITKNLDAIIEEDTLHTLSSETFQRILQYPSLTCPEINLFQATLKWHSHHYGDFNTHRESLLLHLSKLELKLLALNSLADQIHPSGVFSKDEMAELYRLRITLGQFGECSRHERKVRAELRRRSGRGKNERGLQGVPKTNFNLGPISY